MKKRVLITISFVLILLLVGILFFTNNIKNDLSVSDLYPTITIEEDVKSTTDIIANSEENNISTVETSKECFSQTIDFEEKLYGSLILFEYGSNDIRLVILSSGVSKDLGSVVVNMALSPGQDRLAYVSENPQVLHIVDGGGNIVLEKSISPMWNGVISWINDNTLLLEDNSNSQALNSSIIKFSLEDDSWESLDRIPSTFNYGKFQWGNYESTNLIFSPDFERLVYPGPANHGYSEIVLYDYLNSEKIFAKNGVSDFVTPTWSQNGEFVVMALYPKITDSDGEVLIDNKIDDLPYVGGYDLFRLGKNSQIIDRLTFFSTEYIAFEEQIALSNDESKLAFWITKQEESSQDRVNELAILNLESQELVFSCLTISGYIPGSIHWSPDDNYLAVNYHASNNEKGIVLVDITNQQLMRFGWKNEVVKGWLLPN